MLTVLTINIKQNRKYLKIYDKNKLFNKKT